MWRGTLSCREERCTVRRTEVRDVDGINMALRVATLHPDGAADDVELVRLADIACRQLPVHEWWMRVPLGMAYYRAGTLRRAGGVAQGRMRVSAGSNHVWPSECMDWDRWTKRGGDSRRQTRRSRAN